MATKKKDKKFQVINLKYLCDKAKIPYMKVYNNIVEEKYNTLDFNERTILSNALLDEVKELFNELGFSVQAKRIINRSQGLPRASSSLFPCSPLRE